MVKYVYESVAPFFESGLALAGRYARAAERDRPPRFLMPLLVNAQRSRVHQREDEVGWRDGGVEA